MIGREPVHSTWYDPRHLNILLVINLSHSETNNKIWFDLILEFEKLLSNLSKLLTLRMLDLKEKINFCKKRPRESISNDENSSKRQRQESAQSMHIH